MTQIENHNDETKSRIFVVIENFLAKEAYSGYALFGAAIIALIWANSPWSAAYFDMLHLEIGLSFGEHSKSMELVHWINDGIMVLFFLLIGLEVKRELLVGELSSLRKAAFPIAGALGGMLAPILFYLILNFQGDGELSGFGITMATDIAFALGFLLLLGKRVPLILKIFITSLAVFDDLGAIIVIALFYTGSMDVASLGYAAIVVLALIVLNRFGIKELWPYLILGILLWIFVEASGIHATIAGVVLALTIPVRSRIDSDKFLSICDRELTVFNQSGFNSQDMLLTPEQQDSLECIESAYEAVQNPLVRLEHRLHPISAFFIMPVFALFNAGVQISGLSSPLINPVSLGIMTGLMLGKPFGIFGFTFVASYFGWVEKPAALSWHSLAGVALLGGVGFTMSIFVTQLAFDDSGTIGIAKLFIVICSLIMGIAGILYLLRTSKR